MNNKHLIIHWNIIFHINICAYILKIVNISFKFFLCSLQISHIWFMKISISHNYHW